MFAPESAERRCSFPGCHRAHCAKGLCRSHYTQQKATGALRPLRSRVREERRCSFEGCGEAAVNKGLCQGHHAQRKKGQPLRHVDPSTAPKVRADLMAVRSRGRGEGSARAMLPNITAGGRWLLFRPRVGCDFPGCAKRHFALGYCQGHWGNSWEKR